MKRVAALLLAAVAHVGCETAVSSNVTDGPSPVKCQVALAAPSMIDARGGSGSLGVTTQPECGWEASTNVSWISALSPPSGQGTADVSFRVAANDGASTRDGMIVVNGEQVRVSQRAACRYDVAPSSQSVNVNGGPGTLKISAPNDCAWRATSDVSWIALTSSQEGSGNGTVSYTVARNQGQARDGAIAVADQRATISQAGVEAPSPPSPPPSPTPPPPSPPACTFSISPNNDSVPVSGDSGSVQVSTASTCAWKASSNASWITIASGASGTGNGSVRYQVSANSGASRTGSLTIANKTFTVTQAAFACSFSISPGSQRVDSGAGAGTVAVSTTSTCRWTASSNDSWIVVTAGASGTGNGTVSFRYSANTGRDREGTLTIAGRTATVEQRASRGRGND